MSSMSFVLKMFARSMLLIGIAISVASCDPQVYGSVGMSSSSWGRSSPGMHGSISVGGRICC